jgi:cell filamentation protein, protein adenylyltransferase
LTLGECAYYHHRGDNLSYSPKAPSVNYRLDKKRSAAAMATLDERRRLFDNLPVDPLHLDWLRRRAWIRTIHGTTRIEGNTLSDIEVDELLTGAAGTRLPRKDALEILGSRAALSFVDELAGDPDILPGEHVVREIHRRVLDGQSPLLTPGEYRRGENRVGRRNGEVIFTTPPSGDLGALMRAFGKWLSGPATRIQPPIAAALAHLELVAIHPFNDGNGRTARALGRLFLVRGGYALGGLVSLDAYLDQDRDPYFAAISTTIGRSYEPPYDATPFVSYFIDGITRSADHVLGRIRELGAAMILIRQEIASGELPPAMITGLGYAVINRSIRPADYMRVTGRSKNSATRDLRTAEARGFLVSSGQTRTKVFLVGPRLATAVIRPT